MTGSAGLSLSQSKVNSEYASVGDQSGLFAGNGGYDIYVGNHTQLNGAVIASTAQAADNALSTGTLGWSRHRQPRFLQSQQLIDQHGRRRG